jgi:predicted glycosyltransferase
MVETLRAFIDRRLRELREAEIPLREQLSEIDRERREIEKTAKAIGLESARKQDANHAETQKKTMKEVALEILSTAPKGLTALEILRELNTRMNTSYERTSLSPQLSRLKQEGKVVQDGIAWLLVKPSE